MTSPNRNKSRRLACMAMLSLLPTIAVAGTTPPSPWRTTLTAAYAGQASSDLDSGGEFSADRGIIQFEAARRVGQRLFAGLSIGYGEDRYRFDDTGEAGVPWGDIRSVEFGLTLRYAASDKWTLFGIPVLRYMAERGADLSDGRELGLLTGASYRVNDRLTIGPGIGLFDEIGGETDLFPVLLIDWRLTDTLSLETGRGLAASRGPGLSLKWRPAPAWEFGLAGRYEKSRFRLADGQNGIGQDSAVPLVATATWQPTRAWRLSAFAGAEVSGSLRREDSDGNRLDDRDYATAPLFGLVASRSF